MVYNLCYMSVLQRPPAAQVVNGKNDVVVTIEQFWLSDYWRKLKPSNLTLIYEFPVAVGRGGIFNIVHSSPFPPSEPRPL